MNRFEILINQLQDKSDSVKSRYKAARKLGIIGDPRAVKPLIAMLGNDAEELLSVVKETLDKIYPDWRDSNEAKNQISELIACLIDNNETPTAQKNAAFALGEIKDPRAVEPLMAALGDKNEDVRSASASALCKIKDPRAVEPLVAALRRRSKNVRLAATQALGLINDPRTVEFLIAELKDTDEDLRSAVVDTLNTINPDWRDSNEAKRQVLELISILLDVNKHLYFRSVAAYALGEIKDPRAVEPLVVVIKGKRDHNSAEGNRDVHAAIYALSKIKDSRAVDLLLDALKDKSRNVRTASVMALGEIKDPRAVEPLIAALGDKNGVVRWVTATALAKIKDSRAVEPLIAVLKNKDKDPGLLGYAIEALGEIKDPRAVEALIAALKDEDKDVRSAAAWALGEIKDQRAIEPLIAALKDEDKDVCYYAEYALSEINPDWRDSQEAKLW